jgi:hypothetical protein
MSIIYIPPTLPYRPEVSPLYRPEVSRNTVVTTSTPSPIITAPVLIEDVSRVRHFQTHNINGTPKSYKTNDVVYYRNRFFVAVKNTTREPFSISTEWKEIFDVPARYDISETEPKGLKKPGDQWESTITSLVYTYIKNNNLYNQYVWVSD